MESCLCFLVLNSANGGTVRRRDNSNPWGERKAHKKSPRRGSILGLCICQRLLFILKEEGDEAGAFKIP